MEILQREKNLACTRKITSDAGRRIITQFLIGFIAVNMALESRASEDLLETGWTETNGFRFNEAEAYFRTAAGQPGVPERERKLGEALNLLNVQPRTQKNIDQADHMLREISQNTDDEAGVLAQFYVARILEMHRTPVQTAQARQLYLNLAKNHSGLFIAEYAVSKIALIDLYDDISAEEMVRRIAELERLEPLLKTSQGRREFHLNIGLACAELKGPAEKALQHLLSADREGITRWQTEAVAWILIGEFATRCGNKELAKKYYGKFLDKYRRDNRNYTIRERLVELSR